MSSTKNYIKNYKIGVLFQAVQGAVYQEILQTSLYYSSAIPLIL